jgi:hypothetical protein
MLETVLNGSVQDGFVSGYMSENHKACPKQLFYGILNHFTATN